MCLLKEFLDLVGLKSNPGALCSPQWTWLLLTYTVVAICSVLAKITTKSKVSGNKKYEFGKCI